MKVIRVHQIIDLRLYFYFVIHHITFLSYIKNKDMHRYAYNKINICIVVVYCMINVKMI